MGWKGKRRNLTRRRNQTLRKKQKRRGQHIKWAKGNKREKNFDLAIFLKEQSSDGVQIRNVLKKGKRK